MGALIGLGVVTTGLVLASGWTAGETGEAVEKSANSTIKVAAVAGALYLGYRYIARTK